eukprot:768190-Hanusia_phi.AAC.4
MDFSSLNLGKNISYPAQLSIVRNRSAEAKELKQSCKTLSIFRNEMVKIPARSREWDILEETLAHMPVVPGKTVDEMIS